MNVGSENLQCETNGQCRCKAGVVGDKCDQCAPYHYNFGPSGCTYVNLLTILLILYVHIYIGDVRVLNPVQCYHFNAMPKRDNVLVKHLSKVKTVTSNFQQRILYSINYSLL